MPEPHYTACPFLTDEEYGCWCDWLDKKVPEEENEETLVIDQNLCRHNVVINGACMMCKKTLNKTEIRISEAIAGIPAKQAEPGYVSPTRSLGNDRDTGSTTPAEARVGDPR